MKINESFIAQMRDATQLLQSAGPGAATAAIQRALAGVDAAPVVTPQAAPLIDINPPPAWAHDAPAATAAATAAATVDTGRFIAGSYANPDGTRAYKLYVPGGADDAPRPLVVMLHGCQQDPDDFAAGTAMNALAEQEHCLVLYPAQAHGANKLNCWNWFRQRDQRRGRGEPSLIAGMTRQIMLDYNIDPQRVYLAGLSAGGAMAAVMAATYPELYAAIGIHSGLPYGVAHNLPSALAAMKNGRAGQPSVAGEAAPFPQAMPVIVFHGERDATVHPRNGTQIVAQCLATAGAADGAEVGVEHGRVPNGRSYTRTIHYGPDGQALAEQWLVHGAGHAWSGGSAEGSYTDPRGPCASREMLRFFYAHPRQAN